MLLTWALSHMQYWLNQIIIKFLLYMETWLVWVMSVYRLCISVSTVGGLSGSYMGRPKTKVQEPISQHHQNDFFISYMLEKPYLLWLEDNQDQNQVCLTRCPYFNLAFVKIIELKLWLRLKNDILGLHLGFTKITPSLLLIPLIITSSNELNFGIGI